MICFLRNKYWDLVFLIKSESLGVSLNLNLVYLHLLELLVYLGFFCHLVLCFLFVILYPVLSFNSLSSVHSNLTSILITPLKFSCQVSSNLHVVKSNAIFSVIFLNSQAFSQSTPFSSWNGLFSLSLYHIFFSHWPSVSFAGYSSSENFLTEMPQSSFLNYFPLSTSSLHNFNQFLDNSTPIFSPPKLQIHISPLSTWPSHLDF